LPLKTNKPVTIKIQTTNYYHVPEPNPNPFQKEEAVPVATQPPPGWDHLPYMEEEERAGAVNLIANDSQEPTIERNGDRMTVTLPFTPGEQQPRRDRLKVRAYRSDRRLYNKPLTVQAKERLAIRIHEKTGLSLWRSRKLTLDSDGERIGRAFRAIAYYEHNGEPHNPIALMYAIGRGKTVKEVNEFMKGLQ
jgi:hypothetical protein